MTDAVNHPAHYQRSDGMECIELAELLPFCEGNAIKYLWRAGQKGPRIEDLNKALWYATRAARFSWWWPKRANHRDTVSRACNGFVEDPDLYDAIYWVAQGDSEAALPYIRALIDKERAREVVEQICAEEEA